MTPFSYERAADVAAAIRLATGGRARYLGGGTNLIDLMREGIERLSNLVDVTGLSREIEERDGGLFIGAGVSNTDLASHPIVRRNYPVLAEAIINGATAQIRNMATAGGNLLQRTRCLYFYDQASRCNKRQPGTGCDAIGGHNRMHAILGASEHCVATHPSDMAVALAALGAIVHVESPRGSRTLRLADFHRLPEDRPEVETNLEPGELITAIELPPLPWATRSGYRKARERTSYAFALVSVAAALDIVDGTVREARIAIGGVAHKPWRSNTAEASLAGAKVGQASFELAAAHAVEGARPLAENGFKVEMARRLVVATLTRLASKDLRS